MENNKIVEKWKKAWKPEIHTTDYALKRIKSAQSAKLTPIRIDTSDLYGHFQGSHGRYETFLDYCPCGDFRRSKLPCKHIYRLAIELGLMDVEVKHDVHAVVAPKWERISLNDTVDIIESLSIEAQRELLEIARDIRSTSPLYLVNTNAAILELLNSEILYIAEEKGSAIISAPKYKIVEFLNKENIPYNPKSKRNELIEFCLEQIPEKSAEAFGKIIFVGISPQFSPKSMHSYLHRKYDDAWDADETGNVIRTKCLDSVLPDDAITNQLIKRGYYKYK